MRGRGPRDSPPAACAYHHHINVILNIHVRSRDRRESVSCVHRVGSSAGFRELKQMKR